VLFRSSLRFAEPLKTGQLVIVNAGIASKPGVMDFWICEANNHWNSFDRQISSRDGSPHHRIQVPCQTFDAILKQQGVPFYLKIDIEGHDYLCVDALKTLSSPPAYLSVELGVLDQFLESLAALGYTEFKCISQFNYLPLQLPASPEQTKFEAGDNSHIRRWRDWVFPQGASGPFGEDTFGLWLDAKELRRVHRYYQALQAKQASSPFWYGKDYSFWLDLHARRNGGETGQNGAGAAIQQPFRQPQEYPGVRNDPVLVPV
jgi:FkbM family methyltransferase